MSATAQAKSFAWRYCSIGCRHRGDTRDIPIAIATCNHQHNDSGECSGVEAAVGNCPIVEIATGSMLAHGIQTGLEQVFGIVGRGFDRLAEILGFKPKKGEPLPDYYAILGLKRGASDEEVKAAHRRLAQQFHPDRTGGSDAKMKAINIARDVLLDPDARAEYFRRMGWQ